MIEHYWLLLPTRVQILLWKGVFQHDWTSGHAMRLNSQTGTEGSPVSSLNCDRSLHSGTGAPECNECRLLTLIGVKPCASRQGTAGTSTAMIFSGIGAQALVRSVALWARGVHSAYTPSETKQSTPGTIKIWQQGPSYTTHTCPW